MRPAAQRLLVSAFSLALTTACSAESPATPTARPSSTDAQSAAASASARASVIPTREPRSLEECAPEELCLLGAGEHETDAIGGSTLSFSLVDEWEAHVSPRGGVLALFYAGGTPATITAFVTTGEVFVNPCAFRPTTQVPATVDDVVAWLAQHPELVVIDQQPATLGGLSGVRLEIEPMKPAPCPVTSPDPGAVMLFELPEDEFYLVFHDQHVVAYVLAAGDEVVLVTAEAIFNPGETFAGIKPILESMEFSSD